MSAILAGSTHKVALIGNPNVGKSTLFNGLTGMRQHTGNWPGKTVQLSAGTVRFAGEEYTLIDLPGTYSLTTLSEDEKVTREYLMSGEAEAVIVVADATALERNLILVMQVLRERTDVVVAVNLLDEARRKGISIDLQRLEGLLGVPVVGTEARNGIGFRELMAACKHVVERRQVAAHSGASEPPVPEPSSLRFRTMNDEQIVREAEAMAAQVVHKTGRQTVDWDTWLDNILTSRWLGFPAMFLLLGVLLWITVAGANVPSEWLATVLFSFESVLSSAMHAIGAPDWLHGFLVLGVYRGVAWVVSVMLPPMAIFFPLFTLLEDLGYLPRIAFNLDPLFTRSGGQGRQALTMAMGLGCNAAGVISCRIIDSPRADDRHFDKQLCSL